MQNSAQSSKVVPSSSARINADVRKFSTDLDEHWAKAETMGFNLTQVLKIKTLIDQAKFVMVCHRVCAGSRRRKI